MWCHRHSIRCGERCGPVGTGQNPEIKIQLKSTRKTKFYSVFRVINNVYIHTLPVCLAYKFAATDDRLTCVYLYRAWYMWTGNSNTNFLSYTRLHIHSQWINNKLLCLPRQKCQMCKTPNWKRCCLNVAEMKRNITWLLLRCLQCSSIEWNFVDGKSQLV